MALRTEYPGAKLISPVFRRHMESRRNEYLVASQWFLFVDASGRTRRGHIDGEGRLTVQGVTFLDTLPGTLRKAYFEGKAPLVPGGQVSGRVWSFIDDNTDNLVYEFEFEDGRRRGVGRIDASGTPASANYIVGNETQAKRSPSEPNRVGGGI